MYLVTKTESAEEPKIGGVAGWLLVWIHAFWTGVRTRGEVKRHMKVVETLSLGGRKQLHLVRCAGERFLVGTGAESVETIVAMRAEIDEPMEARGAGESS